MFFLDRYVARCFILTLRHVARCFFGYSYSWVILKKPDETGLISGVPTAMSSEHSINDIQIRENITMIMMMRGERKSKLIWMIKLNHHSCHLLAALAALYLPFHKTFI